jgi:Phage P22-like portal protein
MSCSSKTIRDQEQFLLTMRKRFLLAEEALRDIHEQALLDWKFREGGSNQWDEKVLRKREAEGRPVYSINRIPQFLRQVLGDQKKSRPSIQVSPIGSGADEETAQIEQGLVRHIERTGDAEESVDTAFDHMLTGGFGFVRLVTRYADDEGNHQDVAFQREPNSFAHYPDPRCKTLDYSDARFWFVIDVMTEDDYREEYPDSELAGISDFGTAAQLAPAWISAGEVRCAEYYWTEPDPKDKRKVKVFWCKTNGIEILEEEDVPGKYIPIVPLLGEEVIVEGRRNLIGLVRYAREPQKLYNLWQSAMAEAIAMAPKAPYVGTSKQFEGYEDVWEESNNSNFAFLPYNVDPQAPGAPQRQIAEPAIQAIQSAILHADNDLKNTTGLDDSSLGKRGPEEAARAIMLRQQKGDTSTFGFQDAVKRAITQLGRIIIGWIPHYYDAARTIRILNPDGSSDNVLINEPFFEKGLQKIYDLTAGTYDVSVSLAPSHESARQEAAESMLQLVQAQPELMNVIGDLLVSQLDWPMAKECAERLKKMLPPPLQDDPNAEDVPPAAKAKIAQMGQMLTQMTTTIHALSAKLETQQVKAASDERRELIRAAAGIEEAALKAKSTEGLAAFQADQDHIDRMLSLIPDPAMDAEAGSPGSADGPAPAPQQPQPQPQPQQIITHRYNPQSQQIEKVA